MSKIAPTLRRFMLEASLPAGENHVWTVESKELWVAAERELRALLSVARAAERHLNVEHYPWGASEAPSTDSLHRAVDRVVRVSRPPKRRSHRKPSRSEP